jgi:hypothetical protein
VKVMFRVYPLFVVFVVVATGNHYLFDAFLGAVTAGIAWLAARRLARLRPECWAFGTAEPPPFPALAPAPAVALEAAR